jgi:hypothetical protein
VTTSQRLISCLLVAHLLAVFVAAVPGLSDFGEDEVARLAGEPVSPVAAGLDAAAVRLVWLHRVVYAATSPLRPILMSYVRLTGQFQRWNMFCNPARVAQFARIGYRIRAYDGTITTEYESIFPAGPPGVVKLVSAYFDSFMDKALANAGENYRSSSKVARASGQAVPTDQMVTALMPYTRYFGRRRERAGLPTGAQLAAVEFWWGTTPAPAPPWMGQAPRSGGPGQIDWQLWAVDPWP